MKKNIAIDCSWFKSGKAVGYNSYVKSLLEGLILLPDNGVTYVIFCPRSEINFFKKYESSQISLYALNTDGYLSRFIWLLFLTPFYYRKFSAILFTSGFCGIFCSSKKILVLHDLNYIFFPNNFTFTQLWFRRIFVYLSCLFSDRIICISNSVKKSCFRQFINKCIVIHNSFAKIDIGCDSLVNVDVINLIHSKIDSIKIVIPSSLAVHKNLKNAYTAAVSLKLKDKNVVFFIIGNWTSLPAYWPISDNIIPLGFVSDIDKDFLFQCCDIILVPSIFEGFGLPYLEAMIYRKILVSCNIDICRELAGSYPVYINDPFDEDSILIALHESIEILYSNSIRSTPELDEFTDFAMASKYFNEAIRVIENG